MAASKRSAMYCRHRGAKVEEQPVGRRNMFSCPVPGGADRTGTLNSGHSFRLRFRRDRPHGPWVDRKLPADEYAGLVWVVPTPGEPLDMAKFVGSDLSDDVAASGIASAELYRQETLLLTSNGKLRWMASSMRTICNSFIHKRSGSFFHTNIYTFDAFGRHSRLFVRSPWIEDTRDDAAESELWRLRDRQFHCVSGYHHDDRTKSFRDLVGVRTGPTFDAPLCS